MLNVAFRIGQTRNFGFDLGLQMAKQLRWITKENMSNMNLCVKSVVEDARARFGHADFNLSAAVLSSDLESSEPLFYIIKKCFKSVGLAHYGDLNGSSSLLMAKFREIFGKSLAIVPNSNVTFVDSEVYFKEAATCTFVLSLTKDELDLLAKEM